MRLLNPTAAVPVMQIAARAAIQPRRDQFIGDLLTLYPVSKRTITHMAAKKRAPPLLPSDSAL